jgi:hypothetical protein
MRLRNNTKNTSKVGYVVVIDPSDPLSFIYAPADSNNILGVITEAKPYRESCEIATSGVASVYVQGNTQKGSIIRSRKKNETLSAGACKVAKTTDTPFFMIGTALESGKGLVKCQLAMTGGSAAGGYVPYIGAIKELKLGDHLITASTGHFTGMSDEAPTGEGITLYSFGGAGLLFAMNWDTITAIPLGVVASVVSISANVELNGSQSVNTTSVAGASYDVDDSDYYIKCDSAVDMVVNLPEATSSDRVLKIKNVNTAGKIVTVTPLGAETIDGEATQTLYENDCIELVDDDINGWSIA